jgi:hypothetical protein
MHGFGERYKRIKNLLTHIKVEAKLYPTQGDMIDHCLLLIIPPSFGGFKKIDKPLWP